MRDVKHILAGILLSGGLLLGGAAAAVEAEEYIGTVNHVFDQDTLRIAYRYGGQIQVRVTGLDGGERAAALDELLGRTVRVVDGQWREGFLEGRLEVQGMN